MLGLHRLVRGDGPPPCGRAVHDVVVKQRKGV